VDISGPDDLYTLATLEKKKYDKLMKAAGERDRREKMERRNERTKRRKR
jgi:hypothetical protein